jgi:hypothetical protein
MYLDYLGTVEVIGSIPSAPIDSMNQTAVFLSRIFNPPTRGNLARGFLFDE